MHARTYTHVHTCELRGSTAWIKKVRLLGDLEDLIAAFADTASEHTHTHAHTYVCQQTLLWGTLCVCVCVCVCVWKKVQLLGDLEDLIAVFADTTYVCVGVRMCLCGCVCVCVFV